jgi:fructose-specific phosphotransferase system IIC component
MVSQHPPTQPNPPSTAAQGSSPVVITSSSSTSQATPATISITAVTGAVAGILVWALQTYVFHANVPGALQPIIPILAGGLVAEGTHLWTIFTKLTNK